MDKTQIVGKRQIEMLEGFVNKSEDLITDTLRVMVSGQKLTEEEQMIIKYSMIAYVISRAIPEAYYDRVIINIKKMLRIMRDYWVVCETKVISFMLHLIHLNFHSMMMLVHFCMV